MSDLSYQQIKILAIHRSINNKNSSLIKHAFNKMHSFISNIYCARIIVLCVVETEQDRNVWVHKSSSNARHANTMTRSTNS